MLIAIWPNAAAAHGADVVMLEALIDGDDVQSVAYLGQRPVMRMLVGRDDRPVNEEVIVANAKAIVEHAQANIDFRVAGRPCEPGPVLRLDKDPDGQAVRLVRRYRCPGAAKKGIEVDFRPFVADQPFKVFLLGIFFAEGKTQAHTFTGASIPIYPATFREPARADRLSVFPALFPPREAPGFLQNAWNWSSAFIAVFALAVLALVGLGARRAGVV